MPDFMKYRRYFFNTTILKALHYLFFSFIDIININKKYKQCK